MALDKKVEFCSKCVNPKGFGLVNPVTGEVITFEKQNSELVCSVCKELLSTEVYPKRSVFDAEFKNYLKGKKKVLFAYSGGLDSTVVLIKLLEKCQEKNIDLELFTILTGVKGIVTAGNIRRIISYLDLEGRHFFVDITNRLQTNTKITQATQSGLTTFEVYKYCIENNILPCGKICNTMLDSVYKEIMNERGYSELITGGDTPKMNEHGVYSLFWKKKSGITILRGGFAFELNKNRNAEFVKNENIPWIHPMCGGYDTDCLIPGVYFYELLSGQKQIDFLRLLKHFPIIWEYLTERVRFGVIDRHTAIKQLEFIDICSQESFLELQTIFQQPEI